MSESLNVEMLTRMLEKMPGVGFCSRMDPATRQSKWLYLNERAAELYDVEMADLMANPYATLARVDAADRGKIEEAITAAIQAGAPMAFVGRMVRRDGRVNWVETHANIERDSDGTLLWYGQSQDVTERKLLEAELHARNDQLAQSEEAKNDLIKRLRLSLEELSNPILEVWDGVLAMPIIGIVDSRRAADMVQRLLAEVTRTQASFVIVDLTGVEIVDTKTADHLMRLMKKVEVVGARCVLTGIRPAVAETLVDIGVDFGRLSTLRNLKHGLRDALRLARREREGFHDADMDEDRGEEQPSRRRAR